MLTEGEIITAALRFGVNPGDTDILNNQELRERARYFLQVLGSRAIIVAPSWFKQQDDQATLTDGVAPLPPDFGSFGQEGHVFVNGVKLGPLDYVEPDVLAALLADDSTPAAYPSKYTLYNRTALGVAQLATWPINAAPLTLDLKRYNRVLPDVIDIPIAPTPATTGSGLLSGTFTWRTSFKTAAGETEAGPVSEELALALGIATLAITTSPCRSVTARGIYRGTGRGTNHQFIAYTTDNQTLTYADNSLVPGVIAPEPADNTVSAIAMFPSDFHTEFSEALIGLLKRPMGDTKAYATQMGLFETSVRRMWQDQKQRQNTLHSMAAYGSGGMTAARSMRSRITGG